MYFIQSHTGLKSSDTVVDLTASHMQASGPVIVGLAALLYTGGPVILSYSLTEASCPVIMRRKVQ